MNPIVEKLRKGELDCNMHQFFFAKLIKGLMVDLRSIIKIRNIPVPHMIVNTGDDTMWVLEKDYDYSKEPCEVTNEQYVYNIVPRCIVSPGSLDMIPDQLTNPYVRGNFQYEHGGSLFTLNAEFRRMPIKVQVNLKYILDSFTDVLEMMQHVCTKLAFVRTYKFVYLGQTILCSYKIPDTLEDQHMTEISGDTTDSRDRIIEFQIEVESNIPVFSEKTIVEPVAISHPIQTIQPDNHETITRDYASRSGHRGPRFGKR